MNRRRLFRLALALAALIAIAAPACGPSLEQQEALEACRQQCGLDMAQCFETRTCLAVDGQVVPCEEECQTAHDACEERCVAE
jgi:hypothetical protein